MKSLNNEAIHNFYVVLYSNNDDDDDDELNNALFTFNIVL